MSGRTEYRDYLIYDEPAQYKPTSARFEWQHKDFDEDDHRRGFSATLDEAKADIDEQIAGSETDVEADDWQPIETAPRSNGSNPFLAYIPGHGHCVCCATVLGNIYSVSSNRTIHKATHWMPLPPPPSPTHPQREKESAA